MHPQRQPKWPEPWAAIAASLAALVITLAACSSGGDTGGTGSAAPSTTERTTTSTTTTIDSADPASVPTDPSDGCGTEPDVEPVDLDATPGDVERRFVSEGTERTYRLAVPSDYDPDVAAPLVMNLHGSGSNALQASTYGDVPRAAAARGMLTVAAEAIGGQWELAGVGADATFLLRLLDDVESRYCVDLNRVHIVGMSLGAWKAAVTGCVAEGRFASLSLVTVEVFPGSCEPMAIVAFHGTADRVVPYAEGDEVNPDSTNGGLPGAQTNAAAWAVSGGCEDEPQISRIGDDVELRRFDGCELGVGVELYSIEGGGHTWPGSDISLGPESMTTQTIDATELTLDWFEAHPRRT